MPREVVQLSPGKPEVIALKFAKGKDYGERVMFSTACNRILYLDQDEARELERMGIAKDVPFTVTKRNGHCEFAFNGAGVPTAPAPSASQSDRSHDTPNQIGPVAARLMASYMTAVDTLLETQVYAQRKGLVLAITCEDVRCLAATVFINADGAL